MEKEAFTLHSHRAQRSSDGLDLKRIITLLLRRWYFFPLVIVFTLAGGFVYNRYTMPTFLTTASILIEEESKSSMPGSDEILEGFGLRGSSQNLDNQQFILSSWTLISETLQELSFGVDFYRKGRVMTASYYPDNPIEVVVHSDGRLPYNLEFSVTFEEGNRFRVATEGGAYQLDTMARLGQRITHRFLSFTINPTSYLLEAIKTDPVIYFKFRDNETLTANYVRRLKVQPVSRDATILLLSLEGNNRQKDIDFLNQLLTMYLIKNLDKKNYESERIIDFIDAQLVDITDSLMLTENRLQEFRSENRVMDISAQGQQIIQQAMKLEEEKARLVLQGNYFNYLTEYLSKESTLENPIAPSSMGIEDPLLATLLQELVTLQNEFYSGSFGEKNPLQAQLALKISNTRESLDEALKGIVQANAMARRENAQQIRTLNSKASGLPETERKLLGIEREFKLNDVLYTFLITKQAEAQIQKASNAPDNEVIDAARSGWEPIAPQKSFIYIFCFLLGLMIPAGLLLAADAFNNKITNEEDLKNMSRLPMVGQIPRSDEEHATVVLNNPASMVAEAFRSLRTRMQYFTKNITSPVILVTSSMPGEGKTFTALNLASVYSLAGKRTVLLGFDLRRPMLHTEFEFDNKKGITTYLIGQDKLEDIIQETKYKNLHIIHSGPIPPNPSELIASDLARNMIAELREQFDYVIIDSAPLGSVSDSFLLAQEADTTLLMVRYGKTIKSLLNLTLEEIDEMELRHVTMVYNGIRKARFKYGYGNKYGYSPGSSK